MAQFTQLTSRVVVLLRNDIDTDQIIPARFLKVTEKDGLGKSLFCDWRYREDVSPNPDFVLNRPESQWAQVLFAGDNFGCGSSREHAPWALTGYGFRAVISTSFADIFKSNALKNGLLPVVITAEEHAALHDLLTQNPSTEVTIDLEHQWMIAGTDITMTFPIDGFAKTCLLNDVDELGYLLRFEENIRAYENSHL
ncbi:MAG: 3-isopropylmalate dehydratase small subunit [Ignavibacteriales bacterium]|nr:3-isopropylmalate dehydratase small subunit [Ignavibacteriales bacterium]